MVLASSQASSSPFLLHYISVINAPLILACPYVFIPLIERKKESYISVTLWFSVVPTGIEPVTQGFSVLCSQDLQKLTLSEATNWAMVLYPLKELNSLPISILRFNSRFNSWIFRDWGCQYVNYLNVKLAISNGLCKLLDE